jgi:hypothetical protein
MWSLRRLSVLSACFVVCLLPASLAAQVEDWTEGPERPKLTTESLIPTMAGSETYSERYTFGADLDDGGRLKIEFTVGNVGPGDEHGAVSVRLDLPGRSTYAFQKKVSDWSYSKETFRLEIAGTTVEAVEDDQFRLTHRNGDVALEVVFERTLPMWRPGNGRIAVDDRYMTTELIAPRADVTGTFATDAQTRSIRGTRSGLADHAISLFLPYQLARRFSRHHVFDDDLFVAWREIQLLDAHGGESLTWIVVGYEEQIVFSNADAEATFLEMKRDSETGYRVPLGVRIRGRTGGDSVTWRARGRNLRRRDLLAVYGPLVRMLARAVTQPYQYRLDADYTLQMSIEGADATVRGEGTYSMDYFH